MLSQLKPINWQQSRREGWPVAIQITILQSWINFSAKKSSVFEISVANGERPLWRHQASHVFHTECIDFVPPWREKKVNDSIWNLPRSDSLPDLCCLNVYHHFIYPPCLHSYCIGSLVPRPFAFEVSLSMPAGRVSIVTCPRVVWHTLLTGVNTG